jgi:DNA primase
MNAEAREQVQQLKAQLDLVEIVGRTVKLKRQGRAYLGLCPFHDNQRTPAFAARTHRPGTVLEPAAREATCSVL